MVGELSRARHVLTATPLASGNEDARLALATRRGVPLRKSGIRPSPHTRTTGGSADDGPAGCVRPQKLQAWLRRELVRASSCSLKLPTFSPVQMSHVRSSKLWRCPASRRCAGPMAVSEGLPLETSLDGWSAECWRSVPPSSPSTGAARMRQ